MYPAQKQLDTRVRELIEEITEVKLYLDDRRTSTTTAPTREPPQLSC